MTAELITPEAAAELSHLDAFLVENPELEALNARLGTFNLFQVLRIERAEIRHSNVLAWLLTPSETHGLGDKFLRRFLSRLLMENQEVEVSMSPAQVELMRLDDAEVLREWGRIDILARSRTGRWCLLIENKIGSRESPGQLLRYKERVKSDLPEGTDVIPVLLTLEGDEPSDEGKGAGYVPLSHELVLELTETLVEQNRSRIPSGAQTLLDDYIEILRRLTVHDEELVNLCKTIYRKHREAIDLIVRFGSSSQVMDACEQVVAALPDIEFHRRTSDRVWFLPKEMAKGQAELLSGWDFLPRRYPIVWWYEYRKTAAKLQLTMEVGPLEPELRIRLLKQIKDAGFSFWKGAFRPEAKYTRILSEVKKLRDTEDGDPDDSEEYVKEVAAGLWKRACAKGSGIVDVLTNFDW